MLKAMLNKESFEGLSEELQKEYEEKDGKFYLSVEKVNGLALENVDGLKSTVEKLRTAEKTLQQSLKSVQDSLNEHSKKYEGIDPEVARSALSKIDEIKNWDGETKVKKAVEVAEQKLQAKMNELVKTHSTKVEELEDELANSQSQLQDAIVTSRIIEAIHKEGGSVDLLIPHVRKNVNMIKDNNGKWKPEVINDDGNPRIGDSQGNPMTITQLVQEMKSKDVFAAAFTGASSTGSGKSGSSEAGTQKKTDVKVVKASDKTAMSQNLEQIASGKVQVEIE